MKRIVILSLLLVGAAGCRAKLEPPPAALGVAVIPQPLQVKVTGGRHVISSRESFIPGCGAPGAEGEARDASRMVRDFQAWLRAMGWESASGGSPAVADPGAGAVCFAIEPGELERLGEEGYSLNITTRLVALRSARPAGLFYGMQTLRQLLMAQPAGALLSLPCLEIVDKPRYRWRGFMLDCCRHFFPKEFIKKCLDEMALFKLNRFHWHLTDDQAWRLEIKRYPELAGMNDYSQEDVREIVAYAAERFITVVPEIEMPGHATAALMAYPELSCTGGPFASMAQWGVFGDVYCAGNEKTFAFLQDVLDEVTDLFPGPWVHVGGDECPKARWIACPRCQARLQAEGLADGTALQSWFMRRIEKHLDSRGKRLIGWDEILEGGLAPQATVMSWRGMEGGIEAARQGHDVVMAPTSSVYLDYYQGDPRFEPPAIGGLLRLRTVYDFEPTPADLNEQEAPHVLGGQANLWTEYIATPGHASYMMWPRLCALAEAVWSVPSGRDWDSFLLRLGRLRRGMKSAGMHIAETQWRPVIRAKALPGEKAWQIEMTSDFPDAAIRFTRDGSAPGIRSRRYQGPFECRRGGLIRAALYHGREQLGPVVELELAKHVAVFAPPRVSASGNLRPDKGGEALLVDGLTGSLLHKDGAWLGVEGGDLEAIIDLGRGREVRRVAARFLEHPAAWIFLPARVDVDISANGRDWTRVASCEWMFENDLTVLRGRQADLRFAPRAARYVRLAARGIGTCPAGHTGAGGKAWLFVDEITVE